MEDKETKKTFSEMFQENPKKIIRNICIAVVISVCIIIAFYFAIARYEGLQVGLDALGLIVQPFVIGFAMAFLMNPIMKVMEKPLLKHFLPKSKKPLRTRKTVRVITSIISLIVLLAIIALGVLLIIPDTVSTVKDLYESFGDQYTNLLEQFNKLTQYRFSNQVNEILNSKFSELLQKGIFWVIDYFDLGNMSSVSSIASGVVSVGRVIVNVIIGIFVSVYGLISKDVFRGQLKKIIYGWFRPKQANVIMDVARKTNEVFYGFIIGKIIDSIIIGILCYIGCLILRMPYAVLVSVIVGVTNVVPVFGPYIGAIPTFIIILITDPIMGLIWLAFILALQQLDGNFIGPKILGESTGLSVFWVMFAIVVGGGLFGFLGMLLGVPTMAVIYYVCGLIAKKRARQRQLSEETADYTNLHHVDPVTLEMIPNDPVKDKPNNMGLFRRRKAKDIDKKKKVFKGNAKDEDTKSVDKSVDVKNTTLDETSKKDSN